MSAQPYATAAKEIATSAAPPSTPHSGGAWEAIVDKAVTHVTEYLTSSTREFDPTAALSAHMLHLLDRGTLRDILVERNYNELCGRFGCGNKPRGLLWNLERGNAGVLTFDWPSSSSSLSSASESENDLDLKGEDAKDNTHFGSSAPQQETETNHYNHHHSTANGRQDENEEVVYEEDLYTTESFRLAQRQRVLLNRMQRKKVRQGEKTTSTQSLPSTASRSISISSPIVRRSGLLGASFPQRFCSAECEELYTAGIAPRVSPHLTYDFPSVFSAITNLFPNLSVASLQQLAGAEVSVSWLVKPVQEHGVFEPQNDTAVVASTATSVEDNGNSNNNNQTNNLRPVQVGLSYESPEHLHRPTHKQRAALSGRNKTSKKVFFQESTSNTTQKVEGGEAQPQEPQLLRTMLEQMQVLHSVWSHEVVPRFSESHLPRVLAAQANTEGSGGAHHRTDQTRSSTTASAVPSQYAGSLSVAPSPTRPVLRGPLLLFDFIMNTSSAKTRRLFYLHYAKHRAALQACLSCATTADAVARRGSTSLFLRVSTHIITAMEEKHTRLHEVSDHAVHKDDSDSEDVDLHVDPLLQQQRRELLTTHLFSEDVTATLSRLLMVDYVLLVNAAWSGVWMKDLPLTLHGIKESSSLLRSLLFNFSIPAVLLRAAGSSPEVVGLTMMYLIAAGCCSDAVWTGCMGDEVAFEEVSEVIGLTEADVIAAVRSLMLGEET